MSALSSDKSLAPGKSQFSLNKHNKLLSQLKKLGIGCFLFFLIKGLLWLLVPTLIYIFSTQ